MPPSDQPRPTKLSGQEEGRQDQQQLQQMMDGGSSKDIHFRDIAPAIEFTCWVVVLLAPILRLVNGPAVTSDQFVIQVTLFCVALAVGVGLRLYQVIRR